MMLGAKCKAASNNDSNNSEIRKRCNYRITPGKEVVEAAMVLNAPIVTCSDDDKDGYSNDCSTEQRLPPASGNCALNSRPLCLYCTEP